MNGDPGNSLNSRSRSIRTAVVVCRDDCSGVGARRDISTGQTSSISPLSSNWELHVNASIVIFIGRLMAVFQKLGAAFIDGYSN